MLKYFATNRAIEHLGRTMGEGESDTRHKLSAGGYYFVVAKHATTGFTTTGRGLPIVNNRLSHNARIRNENCWYFKRKVDRMASVAHRLLFIVARSASRISGSP